MKTDFDISIIIPAKDEANRLPLFLEKVIAFCLQSTLTYEIIVVDDGSRDDTSKAALLFKKNFPHLRVLTLPFNRGKGYAVKRGVLDAQGKIVLFTDADGSTPVSEIEKNLHFFNEGYDIVIGSRVIEGAKVKALSYRRWMGTIFNSCVHTFLIKDIKDTQCGFKMFRRSIISPLWARVYLNGFGFDLEVLYLAHQLGYKIKECPVAWTHVDGSKIRLLRDSWRMLINIFQIRNWHYLPINRKAQHMSVPELASMFAQEKKHWWFKAKGEFLRALVGQTGLTPTTVLDAGCGSGHNLEFVRRNAVYVGCDVAHEALRFCQHNGINTLVQCNLEQMSFKPKSFDLIVSLDVIEHVENPFKVIEQLKGLLNDTGKIIITVPAFRFLWSPHDEALSHMRRYNKQDLLNFLDDAGLRVERFGYLFALTFIPVAAIRILRKTLIRTESPSDTTDTPSPLINNLLYKLLRAESNLLGRVPMPFGTSLYAVVSKN